MSETIQCPNCDYEFTAYTPFDGYARMFWHFVTDCDHDHNHK